MNRNFRRGQGNRPNRKVSPAVVAANQLLASGDFAGAAQAFEKLARGAQQRGLPAAGRFFMRAGEAWLMAGQSQTSLPLIKDGIATLAAAGRVDPLTRIGSRIVRTLNEKGLSAQAAEITALLRQHIPGFSLTPNAPGPAGRAPLPPNCPGCGAPLRPDDVEWRDASTAECDYCGSLIQPD